MRWQALGHNRMVKVAVSLEAPQGLRMKKNAPLQTKGRGTLDGCRRRTENAAESCATRRGTPLLRINFIP